MHQTIGEILKDMDLITDQEIDEALEIQRRKGGTIGEILVKLGYVTDVDILFALAAQTGMEVVDLDDVEIEPEVISLVPRNFAETYEVIPVAHEDNTVVVAMADPLNPTMLDELRFMLSCEVRGAVSNKEAVQRALDKYYADELDDRSLMEQAGFTADDLSLIEEAAGGNLDDLEAAVNATPVVKLLNLILLQAIKDKAADIHLEPFENDFKVRYRIDGVLYEMMPPPAHLATALASRVKIMSSLDISERRLPQDGRIELSIGGRPVDLRVATLPVVHGESVVMRILDRSVVNLDLETLGLRPADLKLIKAFVTKPNGIVLVTGPTGSGKTTTLYSGLAYINDIETKIITTEDPVEYQNIDGLIQCPVNPDVGLTYAACLRAILRQDPDVVFVGEIRDLETASIAVEAALTGHLVLSTLHTNDAPAVVTRLIDLGVEHFLLGACLEGVIAQRLVRRICDKCKTPYDPTDDELFELELRREQIEGRTFYYGEGCKKCNGSGYKGRMAIFEMMAGTERLKNGIIENKKTNELAKIARADGMTTLREAGINAVFEGHTTIEEVVKETITA